MPINENYYVDLVDGKFSKTSPAQMDAMFTAFDDSGQQHFVAHFHGGLGSRAAIHQSIETILFKHYTDANVWPYFFVWNSDIKETITEKWESISHTPLFRKIIRQLIELVSAKFHHGAAQGLLPAIEPIDKTKDSLAELEQEAARREAAWYSVGAPLADLTDEQKSAIESQVLNDVELPSLNLLTVNPIQTIKIVSVVGRVILRLLHKRGHHLYNTIVEETLREFYINEIGIQLWDTMKKSTADSFSDDPDIHGGRRFIAALAQRMNRNPQLTVTLVGHSAGAIYITHFLEAIDKELEIDRKLNVIFQAPAVTFEQMSKSIAIYEKRVAGFRLFALNNDREFGYWEVPVVYHGSLLYMISGIFESAQPSDHGDVPIVGVQRHVRNVLSRSFAIPESWHSLAIWFDISHRAAWAGDPTTDDPSLQCTAWKHGELDDNPDVLRSVVFLLKNGF